MPQKRSLWIVSGFAILIVLSILLLGLLRMPLIHRTSVTFTGTVNANGCAAAVPIGDVGCSIQVGSVTVQVMHGNLAVDAPWGSIRNSAPTMLLGKRVEVYAHQTSTNSYTLAGSAGYYVKVLN